MFLLFRHPDLCRRVSYDTIKKWAAKQRKDFRTLHGLEDEPRKFKSIKKFTQHLKRKYPAGEIPVKYGDEYIDVKFQEVTSRPTDGSGIRRHVILYNERLLTEFKDHEIFCDATFSAFPKIKKIRQFFTVMGKKLDKVSYNFILKNLLTFLNKNENHFENLNINIKI